MTFSQRMGIVKVRDAIQVESLDVETRNAIWNLIVPFFRCAAHRTDVYVYRDIWTRLYHRASDTVPKSDNVYDESEDCFYKFYRNIIVEGEWNECLDLVEFIVTTDCRQEWKRIEYGSFYDRDKQIIPTAYDFNLVFERFLVGYRFVNGVLTRITSKVELAEIEAVVAKAKPSVQEQLNKALAFFADRKKPDYAKSIDCSISAVEAQCRIMLKDDSPTLGKAIKLLQDKGVKIHPSLKEALLKLYRFTSDASGIRHAGINPSEVDQSLAHYMLVSCSAFVGYLIAKS